MATIVLGTVGTILGGPLGGTIGSLIGQQVDRAILGGGTVKGPRLGDLSVQTSSYGTPVPRVYGTMRVAGSVIWSTDLKERKSSSSGGKGQPSTTSYSYSVSLAVAVSSRPAKRVRRIWADGKLIRRNDGKFRVKTKFRFYPGSEDQSADPELVAEEGSAKATAFRGLAVAMFEDLQLETFGNRIPMLTFEVEADAQAPEVGEVLNDCSGGAISCALPALLDGYAAHGSDVRSALAPLVETFGVALSEREGVLRSDPDGPVLSIPRNHLGTGSDARAAAPIECDQLSAKMLPASLTLNHYERSRDYQSGQTRASITASGRRHERVDLAAVLEASAARSLAEDALARRWAHRDRMTVRLPLSYLELGPGRLVRIEGEAGVWRVESSTIEEFVVVLSLRRSEREGAADLPADPGRPAPQPPIHIEPTVVRLFDIPHPPQFQASSPTLLLAAANAAPSWQAVPLEIRTGASLEAGRSASAETVMGFAQSVLAEAGSALLDLRNEVVVELVSADMLLLNCDDDGLINGANLAVIGRELIQFGRAEQLGERTYRLSRLLRGRLGSEWAVGTHAIGEPFALIDAATLTPIPLKPSDVGTAVTVTAFGVGDEDEGSATSLVVEGEALRPPSPVHLRAEATDDGQLLLSWTRRSRIGWAWIDGLDAPLGEAAERYRVALAGSASTLTIEITEPRLTIAPEQLAALGGGTRTVSVVQLGDLGTSRPATIQLP